MVLLFNFFKTRPKKVLSMGLRLYMNLLDFCLASGNRSEMLNWSTLCILTVINILVLWARNIGVF